MSADTTQHGELGPLRLQPDLDRMIGQSLVAVLACVIGAAAFHLDGEYIESGMIVSATGLRIDIDSANFGARRGHRSTEYRSRIKNQAIESALQGAA